VTVTETEQVAPIASVPLAKLIVPELPGAVNVPPHVLVTVGEVVVNMLPGAVGSVSLTERFDSAERSDPDAVIFSVSTEVPFGAMLVGLKVLVIVGAALPVTTRVPVELRTALLVEQPVPDPDSLEIVNWNVVVPGGVRFGSVVMISDEFGEPLETVVVE
jgi:hypothetical protein